MIFEKIKELLSELTDNKEITLDSGFKDLGLDSLDIVDLIMQLEEEFGVELEMNDNLTNIGDLVKYIEETKKA
jgi:acyl carrier protein